MITWSLTRMAKAKTATKSIRHWGPDETSGAHTTGRFAVGAPASTWPGSRRLLSAAHSSCLVHRDSAVWLGVQ